MKRKPSGIYDQDKRDLDAMSISVLGLDDLAEALGMTVSAFAGVLPRVMPDYSLKRTGGLLCQHAS